MSDHKLYKALDRSDLPICSVYGDNDEEAVADFISTLSMPGRFGYLKHATRLVEVELGDEDDEMGQTTYTILRDVEITMTLKFMGTELQTRTGTGLSCQMFLNFVMNSNPLWKDALPAAWIANVRYTGGTSIEIISLISWQEMALYKQAGVTIFVNGFFFAIAAGDNRAAAMKKARRILRSNGMSIQDATHIDSPDDGYEVERIRMSR